MFKELYGIVSNLLPAPKEAEEKENKEVAKEKEEKDKEEKDQVNFVKERKGNISVACRLCYHGRIISLNVGLIEREKKRVFAVCVCILQLINNIFLPRSCNCWMRSSLPSGWPGQTIRKLR